MMALYSIGTLGLVRITMTYEKQWLNYLTSKGWGYSQAQQLIETNNLAQKVPIRAKLK